MLITEFAALVVLAATPPRPLSGCIAVPMPMAWHDGAARRDQRPRDIRFDQDRPRPRCFRPSAR